jgi:uridylate kinase
MEEETIVISLGGSLVVPEEIDVEFLHDFRGLILEQAAQGKKFVITVGGGKICRKYQAVAAKLANPAREDLDWIGIASIKLNAELLRVVFGEHVHYEVIANPSKNFDFTKPIVIVSAYRPVATSDVDAILAANTVRAKKIVNLSNIDYVYDSDPRTNPNAQKIDNISWNNYRALIPSELSPGLNTPFDPIASKMAEEMGISVIIMNGKPLSNLKNYLNGKSFRGTTIR